MENLEMLRLAAQEARRQLETKDRQRILVRQEPRKSEAKSKDAGIPIFENVTLVEIHNIGDGLNVHTAQVKHLTPDQQRRFAPIIAYFEASQGEQAPLVGTPLSMVSWLSPAEIKTFEASGILTLENLAGLNDHLIQKFGPGVRAHVKHAAAFLQAQNDGAHVAKMEARANELQSQLDDARRQIADLKKIVDGLQDREMAKLEIPEALRRTA